jgi:hypothetical protein
MKTHENGNGSSTLLPPVWTPTRPLLRRLLWYQEHLASGRGFTAGEAWDGMEIHERTLYRDMDYVRADPLGWDVAFCRRRRRWVLERD